MSRRSLTLPLALALTWLAPAPADAACSDPSNLCIDSGKGAKFEADQTLTAKQLKAKRKGAPGKLSLKIEDGRGSVFIDGRFVGVAPVADIELGAGKHDLQVRDGSKILAEGVINIPKSTAVRVTVHHS